MTDPTPPETSTPREERMVANAAAAGSAAGSAARAVLETGSMGLQGTLKAIGMTTSMALVSLMSIWFYRDISDQNARESEYNRSEMRRIQDAATAERNRLWEANARQHQMQMDAIRALDTRIVDALSRLKPAAPGGEL